MILIKQSTMPRAVKKQEWKDNPDVRPNFLKELRERKKIAYYFGKPHGVITNEGFYYRRKHLQKLWKVEFDMERMDEDYYVEVERPKKEGFVYVPRGKELSDVISQE